MFHRDVDQQWPPFRTWPSRDPQFRLVRTGIFPSYSPSGDRLICNDQPAAILHNRVLVMHADGSHRAVLFEDPDKSAIAPVWSPDGTTIALGLGAYFQGRQGRAVADLALMRHDGTALKILTEGTGNHGFPSWSPDGRQLVYRSSDETGKGLSILEVATGTVRSLTSGPHTDNFPAWSPVGDRIAFTSDRDGDFELYTIQPDGTGLRRLTQAPGNDTHYAWSPDGHWIVFSSARGGFKDEAALHPYVPQPYGELYVMRSDGSEVRALTDDQYEDGTPAWLPIVQPQRGK